MEYWTQWFGIETNIYFVWSCGTGNVNTCHTICRCNDIETLLGLQEGVFSVGVVLGITMCSVIVLKEASYKYNKRRNIHFQREFVM